ncbi:hypothetical protein GCM10025857_25980 [Alicyclobacillus contaminans]|uniref:DUF2653 family protein n=1 Tax=Alicyclobacillus contaminans TaxID=392016 RepID=UPI000409D17A|nr:DUF2653 family protein [Alicyclobacillus contaminans]GMA51241.1 hypothetical protein GCM10025857_25980 [Alicyclobacillus contaminans]
MQLHFSEQDVIDACCVYVANHHGGRPEDARVELWYDDGRGFGAYAQAGWRRVQLTEQQIVDAVAEYLAQYHNFNPYELDIHLQFPDESRIEAYIVRRDPVV